MNLGDMRKMQGSKLLFVSSNLKESKTGAGVCSARNLDASCRVFGFGNVEKYLLVHFSILNGTFFQKIVRLVNAIWYLLEGYSNGSNRKVDAEIIQKVKKEKITHVFVDSSLNGRLIQKIKKETHALISVFFHNCEKQMIKEQAKSGNLWAFLRYLNVWMNEKKTCLYADKIIVLNQRDKDLINRIYGRKADFIFPISLSDIVNEDELTCHIVGEKKKGLFVGSYFFGNVEGLTVFIQNVLPYVNMSLTIVGRGMSKLKIDNPNVTIYDGVESLGPFYDDADFVIAPILSGGGMKVKIAEAMMYGKIIIGTPEAFQGYDDIPRSCICRNPHDFVNIINTLSGVSYNQDVRDCFKKRYETGVLMDQFKNIFKL